MYPRAIRYTHDKIATFQEDHFSKTIAELADLEIRIDHETKIIRQMRMASLELIDGLRSANQRYVLTQYYTELRFDPGGKHRTWYTLDDIANEMGLTTTAVKKIKQRGLFSLDSHHKIAYFGSR